MRQAPGGMGSIAPLLIDIYWIVDQYYLWT